MQRAAEGEGNCQTRLPNFYVAVPGLRELEDARKRLAELKGKE
jgi:hypothetical protein